MIREKFLRCQLVLFTNLTHILHIFEITIEVYGKKLEIVRNKALPIDILCI